MYSTIKMLLPMLATAALIWPTVCRAQIAGDACTSAGSSLETTSGSLHTRIVCDGSTNTYKKMQSWDNSGWVEVNMGSPSSFSATTNVCNASTEGRTVYDKTRHIMLLCNGTVW